VGAADLVPGLPDLDPALRPEASSQLGYGIGLRVADLNRW
jgi:hypothetical protein